MITLPHTTYRVTPTPSQVDGLCHRTLRPAGTLTNVNTLTTIRAILAEEGARGLFRGLYINYIKVCVCVCVRVLVCGLHLRINHHNCV